MNLIVESYFLHQARKAEQSVKDELLRQIFKGTPTKEDVSKVFFVSPSGNSENTEVYFENIKIGEIKRFWEGNTYKVEFEPSK